MTLVVILIVVAVVIAVAVVVIASRRSGSGDGVASFRRQIDALSPEARRPVVDQVQRLEEGIEPASETAPPEPEAPTDPDDPEVRPRDP